MEITTEYLISRNICPQGLDRFVNHTETDAIKMIDILISEKNYQWANWLLSRFFNNDERIKYAIFSAELVIDLFESEFPDDEKPRNAINSAKAYLEKHDEISKNDASAFISDVLSSSSKPDSASSAYSAGATAGSDEASSPAHCVSSAVFATSASVSSNDAWITILNYGIKIFNEREN